MREMKDSGIEWEDQVPVSWKSDTIRNLLISRDGGAWGNEPSEDEEGTICMRIADFDFDKGKFADKSIEDLTRRSYTPAQIQKLLLQKDDICIEKSGGGEKTPVGRAVLFDKDYPALFANFMERLRFDSNRVYPAFVEYWLRAWYASKGSPYYINQTTGIQNINLSLMIAKEKMFFPSLIEQKNISAFLDAKCSEIDALTVDIQSQIDTLEQYKRSVITEAVTKGLDGNVEMKESGIEWAEQIPAHWKVMHNKYLMHKVKEICSVYNGEDILSLTMQGVIVRDFDLGGKMPATFDGYQIIHPGNLLMCLFDYDVTPRCIGYIENEGLTSPAYSQFVMEHNANARYYYYYYLMLDFTKELLHLAKNLRHSFTEEQLGEINTVVPPLNEQKAIAAFLDKKVAEVDEAISLKNEQLATLDAYKKSTIYEYVTGKKEVPANES